MTPAFLGTLPVGYQHRADEDVEVIRVPEMGLDQNVLPLLMMLAGAVRLAGGSKYFPNAAAVLNVVHQE